MGRCMTMAASVLLGLSLVYLAPCSPAEGNPGLVFNALLPADGTPDHPHGPVYTMEELEDLNQCVNEKCSTVTCDECGSDDSECHSMCRGTCACQCHNLPSPPHMDAWTRCRAVGSDCDHDRQTCQSSCSSEDCVDLCAMDFTQCTCDCMAWLAYGPRPDSADTSMEELHEFHRCVDEKKCFTATCSECGGVVGDEECRSLCTGTCECGCHGLPVPHDMDLWTRCRADDGRCYREHEECHNACDSEDCKHLCAMRWRKCFCRCMQRGGEQDSAAGRTAWATVVSAVRTVLEYMTILAPV